MKSQATDVRIYKQYPLFIVVMFYGFSLKNELANVKIQVPKSLWSQFHQLMNTGYLYTLAIMNSTAVKIEAQVTL